MPKPLDARLKGRRKVKRSVASAVKLMEGGEAVTVAQAAAALQCDEKWLLQQFRSDHVQDYLTRRVKAVLSAAVVRAARRKIELLESSSEKVALAAATDILALHGFRANAPSSTVNVNVSPGYIIRLDDGSAPPVTIEAEPVKALEVEPEDDVSRLIRDLG